MATYSPVYCFKKGQLEKNPQKLETILKHWSRAQGLKKNQNKSQNRFAFDIWK